MGGNLSLIAGSVLSCFLHPVARIKANRIARVDFAALFMVTYWSSLIIEPEQIKSQSQ
jgi:hypothetical protein